MPELPGHDLRRFLAVESKPLRSELLDLRDQAINVVLKSEAGVAARRDVLGEVCEAEAEADDAGIVLWTKWLVDKPRLVEHRPELIAWSRVVVATLGGLAADGGAAEDDP